MVEISLKTEKSLTHELPAPPAGGVLGSMMV